jgi:hypothetical protein
MIIEIMNYLYAYIKYLNNSFKFQKLAPVWAELAVHYTHNEYIQIGKVNCMESEMTCKNFDIKQYPYLLWIVNGRIVSIYTLNWHNIVSSSCNQLVLCY